MFGLFSTRDRSHDVPDISSDGSVGDDLSINATVSSFSLNVAFIGTKSSGKTTLVNALLGQNYLKHSESASRYV